MTKSSTTSYPARRIFLNNYVGCHRQCPLIMKHQKSSLLFIFLNSRGLSNNGIYDIYIILSTKRKSRFTFLDFPISANGGWGELKTNLNPLRRLAIARARFHWTHDDSRWVTSKSHDGLGKHEMMIVSSDLFHHNSESHHFSKSGLLWWALPATSIMEISKENCKLFLFWQIHHDTAASFRQKVLILCVFVITFSARLFVLWARERHFTC